MATYVILTRLSPDAISDPSTIDHLGQRVIDGLISEVPVAKWISSEAVLWPDDYLDPFEPPDIETAAKVAVNNRSFGDDSTEVWPVTQWQRFRELLRATNA